MLNPSSFITTNPLEEFSIRYSNDYANKSVALKLFTPMMVKTKTGKFYSYSKDNLRVKSLIAPSGSEASIHEYAVVSKTYTCKERAVKSLVLEKDARDFDRPIADLDQEAAMQNMDALMIELEAAAYTKACTTSNYPSALVTTLTDSSTRWSDAGGDPLENIRAARQAVFEASGVRPNMLFMAQQGLDVLKLNPSIVDRIKYTGQAVTAQILATLFEVQAIHVSDLIKNTALEGAADSLASVWGDEAVLAFVDPANRLKMMTYGRCIMASNFYVKSMDAAKLGRGLGAHFIESGMEYTLESAATKASNDDDFVAGAVIDNIF